MLRALFTLALVFSLSIQLVAAEAGGAPSAKMARNGFDLELSFSSPKDPNPKGVVVTCKITNKSDTPLSYYTINKMQGFVLSAKDSEGKDILYTKYGSELFTIQKRVNLKNKSLAPGSTLEREIELNQIFELPQSAATLHVAWKPFISYELNPADGARIKDLHLSVDMNEELVRMLASPVPIANSSNDNTAELSRDLLDTIKQQGSKKEIKERAQKLFDVDRVDVVIECLNTRAPNVLSAIVEALGESGSKRAATAILAVLPRLYHPIAGGSEAYGYQLENRRAIDDALTRLTRVAVDFNMSPEEKLKLFSAGIKAMKDDESGSGK